MIKPFSKNRVLKSKFGNKLKKLEEFNEVLLSTIPFGIDVVDEKGNVLFMNKKLLSFFGSKSLGKKCWELYKDDKKQCVNCPLKKVIKIGKTRSIESEGCMRGKTFLINHTGMKYNGKLAILEVFTDITERNELDRRKDDFVSMVSHELKNPLTTVKVYAQLIQNLIKNKSFDKLSDLIEKMNKQIYVLQNHVDDLFDTNKVKTGKLKLRKEPFEIFDLISEECDNLKKIIAHKLIVHAIHKEINADKERIRQVLVNLITNAAKYSPKSKKIIVNAKEKNGELLISVQDFGIGINKDLQEKIFDRFFQIEDPSDVGAKRIEGLGLGLFISKNIIDQHGGKIWAESIKGKGSTFFFTLSP